MLGSGWLSLRQAQEALENGRLEEAYRFLRQPEAVGHKGTSALLRQIADQFVERGERQRQHKDLTAAWNDLRQAEKIGVNGSGASKLRQALTRMGVEEAQKLLDAGEPTRASEALGRLHAENAPLSAEIQLIEEVAKGWTLARDLAGRGEICLAGQTADRLRRLTMKPITALERFHKDLQSRQPFFERLLVQLHEACGNQQWRDVVRLSEQMLGMAPHHAEARKARALAWKAIEPARAPGAKLAAEEGPPQRFLLWIDGAGGYLVCLASKITIGQAAPDAFVDVPLLADVSRIHASVTRDPEGYMLEAVRPLQVNGQSVSKALLQPGDRIILGGNCQIKFCQPVPVSSSARLDLVNGLRLPLAVDGILLMADTLVLGPAEQSHVRLPDIERPVILFRQKDGLGVRYASNLIVDGRPCRERGALGSASHVKGDDFSFALEPVGAKL